MKNSDNIARPARYGERGVGLIEAVIGILVIAIVSLVGMQLLRVQAEVMLLADRSAKAEAAAKGALDDLSSRSAAMLPAGGSFTVNADGSFAALGTCSDTYCDLVVRNQTPLTGAQQGEVFAAPWNGGVAPANTDLIYVRRWRVDDLDVARGRKRITIAIFPNGLLEPFVVRRTDVVSR